MRGAKHRFGGQVCGSEPLGHTCLVPTCYVRRDELIRLCESFLGPWLPARLAPNQSCPIVGGDVTQGFKLRVRSVPPPVYWGSQPNPVELILPSQVFLSILHGCGLESRAWQRCDLAERPKAVRYCSSTPAIVRSSMVGRWLRRWMFLLGVS